MLTALRIFTACAIIAALCLFVASFAPIHAADVTRTTVRVIGFASLAMAYVAFEARNLVGRR